MMYLEHFGLERQPFKITPDTSLFFMGGQRGPVLEALKYAVLSGEGIIKVVGEVGSGKTMLCRMLERELPSNVDVVYIANPSLTPENILHVIAFELGINITGETGKLEVLQGLQRFLLEKHAKGVQVVVFIEEAQCMPVETLEEIRLLSNLETGQNKLLQIIMFGQPELDNKLKNQSIRQLKERITHSFYLEPFHSFDIYKYLNFRMYAVGYRGPDIFNKRIAGLIEKESEGLTRRINILADKALLAVYSEGGHGVRRKHISLAAKDSDFNRKKRREYKLALSIGFALLVSIWLGVISDISFTDSVKELINSKMNNEINFTGDQEKRDANEKTLLKERLMKTGDWLASKNKGKYSIQLALVNPENKDINDYLGVIKDYLNMEKVYVYREDIKGSSLYAVLYNEYSDIDLARNDLINFPDDLKLNKPYVRNTGNIRFKINRMPVVD